MSLEDPQTAEEYLLAVFLYLQSGGRLTDPEATVRYALEMHSQEMAEKSKDSQ